jgi:hypothetical protein
LSSSFRNKPRLHWDPKLAQLLPKKRETGKKRQITPQKDSMPPQLLSGKNHMQKTEFYFEGVKMGLT